MDNNYENCIAKKVVDFWFRHEDISTSFNINYTIKYNKYNMLLH